MLRPVYSLVFISFAALATSAALKGQSPNLVLASGPRCFRASDASDYRPGAPGLVQVRAGRNQFEFRLSAGCPDIRSLKEIGLRPRDSSWLCEGKTDELMADGDNRCFISDIRELPSEG